MSSDANYPLNDFSPLPTGAIILRSSDGVKFKTYKSILALASPVFHDMFTLPQADDQKGEGHSEKAESISIEEVPVIDVSESGTTIKILLRLIHPTTPPTFPGISDRGTVTDTRELVIGIEPILAAALKYDMRFVVEKLCAKLLDAAEATFLDGSVVDDTLALRVFVLACQLKLKDMARRAAYACLKANIISVFIEDLRQINAAQYLKLLQFHSKIADLVNSILNDGESFASLALRCSACGGGGGSRSISGKSKWWLDFVSRAQPIISRSPTNQGIFTSEFFGQSRQIAMSCGSSGCQKAPGKWPAISQEIKERIELITADPENDIDLSEV